LRSFELRSVAALLEERLPLDLTLRELGSFRLKDLANPERIYQVLHPQLQDDYKDRKSKAPSAQSGAAQHVVICPDRRELGVVWGHRDAVIAPGGGAARASVKWWMKATAPRRAAGPAPGLWARRQDSTARRNSRKAAPWRSASRCDFVLYRKRRTRRRARRRTQRGSEYDRHSEARSQHALSNHRRSSEGADRSIYDWHQKEVFLKAINNAYGEYGGDEARAFAVAHAAAKRAGRRSSSF
jgi:hypothetical protein